MLYRVTRHDYTKVTAIAWWNKQAYGEFREMNSYNEYHYTNVEAGKGIPLDGWWTATFRSYTDYHTNLSNMQPLIDNIVE